MTQLSPDAGEARASSALLDAGRGEDPTTVAARAGELRRRTGRRAKPVVWPPWVTHLMVPLCAVVLGALGAFLQDRAHVLGPVLLGVVALAALAVLRPRPAASAGVAGWFGTTALVSAGVIVVAGTRQWSFLAGLAVVAVVGLAYVVTWIVWQRAAGRPLDAVVRTLWNATFDPPRWIASWIIGAGIGLPLLALYAPMISDADSAWIVVSTNRVREQGMHLLQVNQDVFLPHLVIGPLVRWGGYPAANGFAVVSVIALARARIGAGLLADAAPDRRVRRRVHPAGHARDRGAG